MEFVAKYDFSLKPGYAAIDIRKGPKQYLSSVIVEGREWKELRDKDLEKLQFRSMAIVNKYSRNPILIETRGPSLPMQVKTEDEDIREFAESFIRSQPDLYFNIHVGLKHPIGSDTKFLSSN